MRFTVIIFLLLSGNYLTAQEGSQAPSQPIVLEWADSLVGTGPTGTGIREFIGNVRLSQGDVTVTCNRAIHHVAENRAELFGDVVVKQGSLTMRSPSATFNGNANIARAFGGVEVTDPPRILTSRTGTYSTSTHIANFRDSVAAVGDTLTVWADRIVYYQETKVSIAVGRVVAHDSIRYAILRGDSLYHDPTADYLKIVGDAAIWSWDTVSTNDTLFLIADSIESVHEPAERFIASGSVELVRGSVAARGDSIDHLVDDGRFILIGNPVLWADSLQLHADTIILKAPEKKLRRVIGLEHAIMVSRSDTARTDRYDQVSGYSVVLDIDADTLQKLIAVDDARSITWRVEDDAPEGLANFTSDTIKVFFSEGSPRDIYWLQGVVGEHHPESVVTGREDTYKLPGFSWRTDRPEMPPPSKPFTNAPKRQERVVSPGGDVKSTTSKKR